MLNVFSINDLKNNLGFFINFGVFFLFIICFFIFIFKSFGQLCADIKEIILAKIYFKYNNNINNNNATTKIKQKNRIKKSRKKNN